MLDVELLNGGATKHIYLPGVAQSVAFFDRPGNGSMSEDVEAVEDLFVREQANLELYLETDGRQTVLVPEGTLVIQYRHFNKSQGSFDSVAACYANRIVDFTRKPRARGGTSSRRDVPRGRR
jgi:hypothetical protein